MMNKEITLQEGKNISSTSLLNFIFIKQNKNKKKNKTTI